MILTFEIDTLCLLFLLQDFSWTHQILCSKIVNNNVTSLKNIILYVQVIFKVFILATMFKLN